jgi:hypothetical protein
VPTRLHCSFLHKTTINKHRSFPIYKQQRKVCKPLLTHMWVEWVFTKGSKRKIYWLFPYKYH